jgi:hypothetical protein
MVGTVAAPRTIVIVALHTQVVAEVAQENLDTIVKVQILTQQELADFHITTVLHSDGI